MLYLCVLYINNTHPLHTAGHYHCGYYYYYYYYYYHCCYQSCGHTTAQLCR